MLDSHLQEYGEIEAARNICIAYGAKDLIPDFPEDNQYSGVWSQISTGSQQPFMWMQTSVANRVKNVIYRTSSLFKEAGPSTQLELLDTQENQVNELIVQIRFTPSIPYRESLANRVLTLFNDAKEEDVLSIGIIPDSLRNFYYFLSAHTNLKRPKISITPDNNIYASWKAGNDRVFSVHFLPKGDVRFVVFTPNNRHPDRPIRVSGIATVDVLMKVVEPFGVLNWAMQ